MQTMEKVTVEEAAQYRKGLARLAEKILEQGTPEGQRRRCCLCGAYLRSSNPNTWCAGCDDAVMFLRRHFWLRDEGDLEEFKGRVSVVDGKWFFTGRIRLSRQPEVRVCWMKFHASQEVYA